MFVLFLRGESYSLGILRLQPQRLPEIQPSLEVENKLINICVVELPFNVELDLTDYHRKYPCRTLRLN